MPKTKIFFIDPLHLLLVYMRLHVFTCIRQSTCVFMLKNTFNNLSTNGTIISQEDTSLQTAPSTESAKNIHHSKRLQPKRWTVSSALGCLCGVRVIHLLHLAVPMRGSFTHLRPSLSGGFPGTAG